MITRIEATCLALELELQALESRLDEARCADGSAGGPRTPRSSACKDAVWAVHRDRLRTARAVEDLAGRDAGAAAIEACRSVQSRCRRSTGSRCAAATRPASTCSSRATGSTSPTRRGAAARGRGATRCSTRARCATPDGAARASSTRPPPRSASSATTPRGCARDPRRRAAAPRAASPRRRRPPCSGTRAGRASASSPRPTRTRSTTRSSMARVDERPYVVAALNGDVDNYADLKAARGLRIPRRDHDRREGDPDARVAPARRRASSSSRRSARRSRRFEGSVAIARRSSADARPAAPRAAGQRAGALRRARRGRLRRRERALRLGRGDDPRTCASTARRRPSPTTRAAEGQVIALDGAGAGTLAGIRRLSYDGTRAAGRRRRRADRADHDPRHRPRRVPHFLLKEIVEAPGVVPQDAARASSSSATGCSSCVARRRDAARRRSPSGCATGPIAAGRS